MNIVSTYALFNRPWCVRCSEAYGDILKWTRCSFYVWDSMDGPCLLRRNTLYYSYMWQRQTTAGKKILLSSEQYIEILLGKRNSSCVKNKVKFLNFILILHGLQNIINNLFLLLWVSGFFYWSLFFSCAPLSKSANSCEKSIITAEYLERTIAPIVQDTVRGCIFVLNLLH